MTARKVAPTKLAARRKVVMAEIKALEAEKAEIDAQLLQLDPEQTWVGHGVQLSFAPFRALDSALIAKKFPASKRPEFYKLALDTAEFKKAFAANELEKYQTLTYRIKVDG